MHGQSRNTRAPNRGPGYDFEIEPKTLPCFRSSSCVAAGQQSNNNRLTGSLSLAYVLAAYRAATTKNHQQRPPPKAFDNNDTPMAPSTQARPGRLGRHGSGSGWVAGLSCTRTRPREAAVELASDCDELSSYLLAYCHGRGWMSGGAMEPGFSGGGATAVDRTCRYMPSHFTGASTDIAPTTLLFQSAPVFPSIDLHCCLGRPPAPPRRACCPLAHI